MLFVSMCFTLTILWKYTLFLGFSLLVKHSFEGWGEFSVNVFFQKERGLFEALCCYMHFLQVWYTLKRKKINLMTKSKGNCSLSKIFDFSVKRVYYRWRNCFYAKSLFDNTHISDITLQRLFLISNSEISISVAPWSRFYVFKDILCTKQPFADVFNIGVFMTWKPSTLVKRESNTGVFLWILRNF